VRGKKGALRKAACKAPEKKRSSHKAKRKRKKSKAPKKRKLNPKKENE
jgi:hypothetical protein